MFPTSSALTTFDSNDGSTHPRSLQVTLRDGAIHVAKGDSHFVQRAADVEVVFEGDIGIVEGHEEETKDRIEESLVSFLADWKPLKKLAFTRVGHSCCTLSARTLIEVFRRASAQLTHFSLNGLLILIGSGFQCNALAATIPRYQPQLQVLEMPGIFVFGDDFSAGSRGLLDPFTRVFSAMSQLVLGCNPHYVTKTGFHALFSSSSLKELHLLGVEWPEDCMITMMQCLENSRMTSLRLRCSSISREGATIARRALQNNETLQCLMLQCGGWTGRGAMLRLLDGLAASNLKKFTFDGRFSTDPCILAAAQQAFERNMHLVDFEVFCPCCLPPEYAESFRFYSDLNANGRWMLLRQARTSQEQWVNALVKKRDCLRSLFYYLSENPALICQTAAKPRLPVQPCRKRTRLYRGAKYEVVKRFKSGYR